MLSREYRGNGLVLKKNDLEKVNHSFKKTPMLRTLGMDNRHCARVTRVMSNHLPCGEFRTRFNKEGPTDCKCGGGLDTREHIIYDCPFWLRPNIKPRRNLSEADKAHLKTASEENHNTLPYHLAVLEAENYASWQDIHQTM